jgi:hypothetical protein
MADITMCSGERCPLKQICYRHTAKPSEHQSYFAESPVLEGTCEYFLKSEPTKWQYIDGNTCLIGDFKVKQNGGCIKFTER